jgi:hypothetical protein
MKAPPTLAPEPEQPSLLEEEEFDVGCKWKSSEERERVKSSSGIAGIVENWQNPNFKFESEVPELANKKRCVYNSSSVGALSSQFNILPGRRQHVWLVAIVPPERWGKMDKNDCHTAWGNLKTLIFSLHNYKNNAWFFSFIVFIFYFLCCYFFFVT